MGFLSSIRTAVSRAVEWTRDIFGRSGDAYDLDDDIFDSRIQDAEDDAIDAGADNDFVEYDDIDDYDDIEAVQELNEIYVADNAEDDFVEVDGEADEYQDDGSIGDVTIDEPYTSPYDVDYEDALSRAELLDDEYEGGVDTPSDNVTEWFEDDDELHVPEIRDLEEWLSDVEDQFDIYAESNEELLDAIMTSLVDSGDVPQEDLNEMVYHGRFENLEDVGEFLDKGGGDFEWTIVQHLKPGRDGYGDDDYYYDVYIKYGSP